MSLRPRSLWLYPADTATEPFSREGALKPWVSATRGATQSDDEHGQAGINTGFTLQALILHTALAPNKPSKFKLENNQTWR